MLVAVAAEQMRGRRTDAPSRGRCDKRVAQSRVLREPEIIVAGEVDEALAVDPYGGTVGAFNRSQTAQQRIMRAHVTRGREAF